MGAAGWEIAQIEGRRKDFDVKNSKAYFRGCLVGGAVGDALGYPVEFLSLKEILDTYGDDGIRGMVCEPETGKALVSDDTQITVFTVDSLLWADRRAKTKGVYAYIPCLFYGYQKWFYTQTGHFADDKYKFLLNGEIFHWEELFARRTPGESILKALEGSIKGKYGTVKNPINNSKGYNAVARVAPIGLYFYQDPEMAFRIGSESAALTHGHTTAILMAGFFAYLIALVIQGEELTEAVERSIAFLETKKGSEECVDALKMAVALADSDTEGPEAIAALGEGWVAEEAMAMAIYGALRHPDDFEKALILTVNQEGNSDGTGAILGSLLGAYLGSLEIPYEWIQKTELGELMIIGADRMLKAVTEEEYY